MDFFCLFTNSVSKLIYTVQTGCLLYFVWVKMNKIVHWTSGLYFSPIVRDPVPMTYKLNLFQPSQHNRIAALPSVSNGSEHYSCCWLVQNIEQMAKMKPTVKCSAAHHLHINIRIFQHQRIIFLYFHTWLTLSNNLLIEKKDNFYLN